MQPAVPRLDALTGCRFVAAAAVVLFHTQGLSPVLLELFGLPPKVLGDLQLGASGVAFFFVLSGFILTYAYPRLSTWGETGRFLLARFARLWPAYMLAILLGMALAGSLFAFAPKATFHPLAVLGVQSLMLQSWVPSHQMNAPYNGPGWSVSAEFAFYVCFVALIPNFARSWWWKLLLALAVPVGLTAYVAAYGWPYAGSPQEPGYDLILYFNPLCRVWLFVLGMTTAAAWQRVGPRLRAGVVVGTLLELVAVGLVGVAVYYSHPLGVAAANDPRFGLPYFVLLHACSLTTAVPFALLIFVLANEWGCVARVLRTRLLVRLGDRSYGVYLFHFPLLVYVLQNQTAFADVAGLRLLAAYWAVLLLLAHWSHAFVEQPLRRKIVGLWPADDRPRLWKLVASRSGRRVAETFAVAAVAVGVGLYATRHTFQYLNARTFGSEVKHALPWTRGVRFGDAYLLHGVTAHEAAGGLRLQLVWEALKPLPPRFQVVVAGTTPPAEQPTWRIVELPDLGFRQRLGPAGLIWKQTVFVPQDKLDAAAQIVLVVANREETGRLPTFDGPLDAHGRLRLFPGGTTDQGPVSVAGR